MRKPLICKNQPKELKIIKKYCNYCESIFYKHLLNKDYNRATRIVMETCETLARHDHIERTDNFSEKNIRFLYELLRIDKPDNLAEITAPIRLINDKGDICVRDFFGYSAIHEQKQNHAGALKNYVMGMFFYHMENDCEDEGRYIARMLAISQNTAKQKFEDVLEVSKNIARYINLEEDEQVKYALKLSVCYALLDIEENDYLTPKFFEEFSISLADEARKRYLRGQLISAATLNMILADMNIMRAPSAAKRAYRNARDILIENIFLQEDETTSTRTYIDYSIGYCNRKLNDIANTQLRYQ